MLYNMGDWESSKARFHARSRMHIGLMANFLQGIKTFALLKFVYCYNACELAWPYCSFSAQCLVMTRIVSPARLTHVKSDQPGLYLSSSLSSRGLSMGRALVYPNPRLFSGLHYMSWFLYPQTHLAAYENFVTLADSGWHCTGNHYKVWKTLYETCGIPSFQKTHVCTRFLPLPSLFPNTLHIEKP